MSTYLDGQLVIADDLLLVQKLNMLTGGPITTPAAVDLSLVPGVGGITKVGVGTPGKLGTPTNNDLFVKGRIELDGLLYVDNSAYVSGAVRIGDNQYIYSVSVAGGFMPGNISQTPYASAILPPAVSNNVIVGEFGDRTVDFGNAQKADPTLIVQSGDATVVAQRVLHYHDRTDGVAETHTGDYLVKTPAQKTLRLGTVVWEDHYVSLTAVQAGGLKPPAWTKFQDDGAGSVGIYAWAFGNEGVAANEEQMWFDAELPHAFKEGADIIAHIHWAPVAGGAAGEFVKWGLEYRWENVDGTFGNTTIITSDASAAATATTSEDGSMATGKNYQTNIGTITGTGKEISSSLLCRIFRNSSDGDDTLAQSAIGLRVAFHHQVDTMGSRQVMVK